MNYILNTNYRLRGYSDLTTGLQNTETMSIIFISPQDFQILLDCDGIHDIDPESLTGRSRDFFRYLTERNIIRPAVFGDLLLPEQMYYHYPVNYRRECQWSITGNCNFKCLHCFMSAPHGKHGHPTFEQLVYMADQLAECGVHQVGITGGEPLIREDFLKLLDVLNQREIRLTTLYTNGWLVNENLLDELEKRSLHPSFQLSFDGLNQHDFLRGIEGAEEKTLQVLKLLHDRGYNTSVSTCLHKKNLAGIRETVNRMAELGVSFMKISPNMELGEWMSPEMKSIHISEEKFLEAVCRYIPQYFADDAPVGIMLQGAFMFTKKTGKWGIYNEIHCPPADEESMPSCGILQTSFYMSASGRILPCMGMDDTSVSEEFRTVFESPLKDILSSPEYQKRINVSVKDVRDANPKCRECRFVDRCIGGCREHALLESNHYYGIAESLCRFFEGGWDEKIRAVAEPAYQEYLSRHPELKNRTSKNEESEDKKEERSILC